VSSAAAPRSPVPRVAIDDDGRSGNGAPSPADVQAAARRLLALARRLPPSASADGVVLDLVIGGARCVVTRTQPPAELNGHGRATHGPPVSALTPREQEIARMVGDGFTNKAIASVLEISSWTVSTHLRRIFGKLDVGTRAAMVSRLSPPFPPDAGHR
jgi:DNA-binding CsgD family transcriptional regulator